MEMNPLTGQEVSPRDMQDALPGIILIQRHELVEQLPALLGRFGTMTASRRDQLLTKFNGNPPAGAEVIMQLEGDSGVNLPGEYKEFLRRQNGGEGFVGNAYAILWRAEELLEMNKSYQVHEYAPGLFLFGSDGGGEAFAFDVRTAAKPIVSVPFVGMELKEARPVASNFNEFLQALFTSYII